MAMEFRGKIVGSLVLGVMLVIAGAYTFSKAQAVPQEDPRPSMPVNVTNEDDEPVPITAPDPLPIAGTVTGTISGTVQAQQDGTWTVDSQQDGTWTVKSQQDGAWNINVANTPLPIAGSVSSSQSGGWTVGISSSANTVEVDNAVTDPVPVRDVDNPTRQPFAFKGSEYTVPAGKRAVVEFFTAQAWGKTNGFYFPYIDAKTDGKFCTYYMDVTRQLYPTSTPEYLYLGTHQVKIYADPGTKIYLKSAYAHVTYSVMSISGYLEDVS